ncbi:MAG TPA: glycosyltransferase, partial [Verrucomicrobiae bacterium]
MPTAPLRILQVNSLFTGGGVDNQTLTLAKGLQDLGEHVVLAIPSGTRYEARAQAAGLSLAAIPARSWLKLSLVLQCASLIRRHRAQILHIHQGRDYWPCILAAKLAGQGTRVVVTRHLMTRPRGLSRRFLLRCVDIIAVSQAVAAVLHAHLKGPASRIHQIYCGTDFSAISPVRTPAAVAFRERMGWPPAAVVFAVIGTFHPPLGKGQPEFLQAAAQLKERYPQARFAIIGHGEMEADLKRQIQESGLGAVAAVFPFEDQIATCMSAIDVLV